MFFGKKKKAEPEGAENRGDGPEVNPEVFKKLDSLQKAGAQLSVRFMRNEAYTTSILGLGRDGFFIDTLSPPSGDRHALEGRPVQIEALLDGESYLIRTSVLGKVSFLDELPAFKLAYPKEMRHEQRRKNRRLPTRGTAKLVFTRPFDCEGEVVDIGEGGLAFEYNAEQGRLATGTRIGGAVLELGQYGELGIKGEVVGLLVAALGGLSLPSTYRAGLRFVTLTELEKARLAEYLKSLEA